MVTAKLRFIVDSNLPLDVVQSPLKEQLDALGVDCELTNDLVYIDDKVDKGECEFAYIPCADYHRLVGDGLGDWKALAILTSKTTGLTRLHNLLVVGKEDPAKSIDDLRGASFGYINKSCTSSWFAPAALLRPKGERLTEYFAMRTTKPWQGQLDALLAGKVRATMVMKDVYDADPKNAAKTKVLESFDSAGAIVCVKRGAVSAEVEAQMVNLLVEWRPPYEAEFGPFRPFHWADVHSFYHTLSQLGEF